MQSAFRVYSHSIPICKFLKNTRNFSGVFSSESSSCQAAFHALFAKDSEKETLYICVKDSGSGIPEEDLNRIFNRFYQSQNQVKYPVYGQAGTGIGLYLCKRIVQMHGGEIKAFNNRHAGCSFRILLPLQRNERKDEKTIIIDHNDSSATPVQDSGSPKEKEAFKYYWLWRIMLICGIYPVYSS